MLISVPLRGDNTFQRLGVAKMPREFLEVLVWVIPIVFIVAAVVIVWIRVKRRGPVPGPHKNGIHIRRKD